jgi:putative ABC transport system permease protein
MAKIGNGAVLVTGVDTKRAFTMFDVKPLHGSTSNLGADAIAVYKNVAPDKHLNVGDPLTVLFATGPKVLRVGLIYGSNVQAGNYFMDQSAYHANFTSQYDTYVFVKKAPGVTTAAALAAVNSVADGYPGAKVLNQSQYKAQAAAPINQLLGLVYVLLLLAVVIALLGIGNTLALSIYERTHELGLMRAVGMTRRQLRATIRWESVIIALQGTALGLATGIFFGWAFIYAVRTKTAMVFSLPYTTLVIVVVLAVLAGMIAAARPAHRAAHLDVLKAVTTE